MTVTRIGQLKAEGREPGGGSIHPEWFAGNFGQPLARAVGLKQFGVNHIILQPGAYSALRHWHEQEDEFVYVLTGELVLIDDNGEHLLRAGDFVGFPAGVANAHHLTNRGVAPVSFLEAGTRHVGEERVHYPDDGPAVRSVVRGADGLRLPQT